jgi:DNA polymerase-2
VDPLGLAVESADPVDTVPGFKGASFSKDTHILPELIEHLWNARDRAKRANNDALSRAIKIIMNSFYGVLGTTACRFFDPRLASSITLRGHEIITRSRAFI